MATLLRAIYNFNTNPIKYPHFPQIQHTFLKFTWNHKRAQAIPRYKSKVGGIILHGFKPYYKSMVIKTVGYWHENRHTDQWNSTGSQEMDLCIYVN